MTGGRLLRVRHLLPQEEPFFLTYGDGVADVDIGKLAAFHAEHGKLATVTAVIPPGRYGALEIERDTVKMFVEKPPGDNNFINGGFFVLHPSVIDRIEGEATPWESEPLESLAREGQLAAFPHRGFWAAVDTLRDKRILEDLWARDQAPWKTWQ
jgi:glucose-1-phosphate cytidylyltransferase